MMDHPDAPIVWAEDETMPRLEMAKAALRIIAERKDLPSDTLAKLALADIEKPSGEGLSIDAKPS